MWRPRIVRVIIRHWWRWFWFSTESPPPRLGAPEPVITNYKRSTANEMEPYWYCCCMSSAFKFPKSSWRNGTTTSQTPKVNPTQQIIQVWLSTIHPGPAAMQV
jgi:hypothetical protein